MRAAASAHRRWPIGATATWCRRATRRVTGRRRRAVQPRRAARDNVERARPGKNNATRANRRPAAPRARGTTIRPWPAPSCVTEPPGSAQGSAFLVATRVWDPCRSTAARMAFMVRARPARTSAMRRQGAVRASARPMPIVATAMVHKPVGPTGSGAPIKRVRLVAIAGPVSAPRAPTNPCRRHARAQNADLP
jgi:hypothetical protein